MVFMMMVIIGSDNGCHLFGTKTLPEPVTHISQLQWNFVSYTIIFSHKNQFRKCFMQKLFRKCCLQNASHFQCVNIWYIWMGANQCKVLDMNMINSNCFHTHSPIWYVNLVAITGTTKLVPYLLVKSLKIKWVRSWNCGCLVTWFCYQQIAKNR